MPAPQAEFTSLAESTSADWAIVSAAWVPWLEDMPKRVLSHLRLLAEDHGGFPVSRLEHCLQTATRAYQAAFGEDYVVSALLHDIGDTLAPVRHAELAAVILEPYVDPACHWMVAHHGVFQLYYHGRHAGLDPDAREQFRGHPCFEMTANFCERFDQASFDRSFQTMPLEAFVPILGRVLSVERLAQRATA